MVSAMACELTQRNGWWLHILCNSTVFVRKHYRMHRSLRFVEHNSPPDRPLYPTPRPPPLENAYENQIISRTTHASYFQIVLVHLISTYLKS